MKNKQADLGFSYRIQDGRCVILRDSQTVTVLKGTKALTFANDMQELNFEEQQQVMARMTGNYKRGNEKDAKSQHKQKFI
ncbi:hypothetical protein [Vibrio sonorensis]|uniref:hypothetical protein n=1 Tax=Vibrio sonorensis TaxID=1004316 RepID=UPI0008D9643D|nr:hypothetical protein [Vibrio sonorensis]